MEHEANNRSRFSREILAGYDPDVLGQAVVLVVGAGALGQNLMINLALSGTGEIRIVDFDEFEDHNAPRSPMYPTLEEQLLWGMGKANVVAHKLLPFMKAGHPVVRWASEPIQDLGTGAFDGVDVVVSCVDNPAARAYLSDAGRWLGVDVVEGGFDGPSIAISTFPATVREMAAASPCYQCSNAQLIGTFSCQRHAQEMISQGTIPAIQASAAALAGIQAEAVIMMLHNQLENGFHRTMFDLRSHVSRSYALSVNPDCEGMHRLIGERPAVLECRASDEAGDLLAEIEARFGGSCQIRPAIPIVVEAPCDDCHHQLQVNAPETTYARNPRCADCGGPFTAMGPGASAVVLTKFGHDDLVDLTGLACSELGLLDAAVFEVITSDSEFVAVRLAGDPANLFDSLGNVVA